MPDAAVTACMYAIVVIFGMVVGSFLNVCIFRIPKEESIVFPNSHCMECGYKLRWYDLIPVFSFIMLGGRCRKCNTKLSLQYPLIEGLNGALYAIVFLANGWNLTSIVYCLLTSALIVISVIDFRTMTIPDGASIFIFILGIAAVVLDRSAWKDHVIGFFVVSGFLLIIFLVSVGRAMGFGDVKLMAAIGFVIGWKKVILGLVIGCIIGSVVHVIRMKLFKEGNELAFAPYLAIGSVVSVLVGDLLIDWYLRICGLM